MSNKFFWFDETFSWMISKQNIYQLLTATAADNNPPLYYLLLHFWMKISQSEFFLRFPSMIFGLINIWLIYRIGRQLFDKKIALTSALIFSLSPLQIYFSAETRMYSLWTMLTLVCFYYFVKILKSPKKIYFFLFAFLFLLSAYTQYFSFLFLLSLDIFLFLKRKTYSRQLRSFLLAQGLVFILFIPWMLLFLANSHPQPWGLPPLTGIPATFLSFCLGGIGAVTLKAFFAGTTPLLIKTIFGLLVVFYAFFFFTGIIGSDKQKNSNKKLLLCLIVFLPIVFGGLVSIFNPIYSPRAFIAFSFVFYYLTALGLEKLSESGGNWSKNLFFGLLFLTIIIQNFYPPFKPQTIKVAADFVEKKSSNSTLIIHTDILTFYPFKYYLKQENISQVIIFDSEINRKTSDITNTSTTPLKKIITEKQPFWAVVYIWDEKTWKFEDKLKKLSSEYQCRQEQIIDDLLIFFCKPINFLSLSGL